MAGIVIATNNRANWLVRITDLWFVVCQLVDRSGQSAVGAVMVNSGPLAAYRAGIIRDNLDGYLERLVVGLDRLDQVAVWPATFAGAADLAASGQREGSPRAA
ncbi:hypothetical protein [Streptomyces sp. NPDC090798]|uniref:hypothetical protein n=1 Tax=Streptomyces sp. NPDC090798 TaxID=3365968 RepID=UPI0038062F84